MRLASFALLALSAATAALSLPSQQHQFPLVLPSPASTIEESGDEAYWASEEGVGHFSQWSKAQKRNFVDDVRDGKANEWILVMGNEGGDLDSMTAALTWSYHLSHQHADTNKTIALLQTPRDALDLRPENKLALRNVLMSPGHRDLLTIDELPLPAEEIAEQLKSIVLVDHPAPLSVWQKAKIRSIFDHHRDRGAAPDAKPRLFEGTASCTTIVARTMLDELERRKEGEYHMPHEVVELILDAIALDSDGLSKGTPADKFTAARLLKRSNWSKQKLYDVMDRLDSEMKKAKKDLEELGVRDLLRRDWKGDLVETPEGKPNVHLGLASIPISLEDQIERTLHNTTQAWFVTEEKWSEEIGADITLALNSFKERDSHNKKIKTREIVLVVRPNDKLTEKDSDELFQIISNAVEQSPFLDAQPWKRAKELTTRQMVWTHHIASGGRKLIRPIVEDAVAAWRL
ncbi:Exopolyphosphatases and related proteins [Ceraceosorus bombacis]|uniref:Exopolyphosphatases and related proteins n=1 Tax=Ceraceosorus bombacis TaxID=401625 RepID=A0A0P1BFG8_9BASI|nr:Exopolyphosphatases and related proteins [Ceraceosorus bombacis]